MGGRGLSRADIILREARELEASRRMAGDRQAADIILKLIMSRVMSRATNAGMAKDIRAYRTVLAKAADAMSRTENLLTDDQWDEIIAEIRAVLATNFPGKDLPDA